MLLFANAIAKNNTSLTNLTNVQCDQIWHSKLAELQCFECSYVTRLY